MEFTEIRALKINGPAKVILDLVKHVETQSDALVEFSVTNEGTSLAIQPLNEHVAAHAWEDFVVGVALGISYSQVDDYEVTTTAAE